MESIGKATKVLVFLFMLGLVIWMVSAVLAPAEPIQFKITKPDGSVERVEMTVGTKWSQLIED